MSYFGTHDSDHSNLNIDPTIKKKVVQEVKNRMKTEKNLCERLCDIVKNKVTVRNLKAEERNRKK
jgi:hypothetical protein